jgi:hypothetical protein
MRFFRWVKWTVFRWGVVVPQSIHDLPTQIPIRSANHWLDWNSIEWDDNGRR